MDYIYCEKCGTQLPQDACFCIKCGSRVMVGGGAQQAAPPAAVVQQNQNSSYYHSAPAQETTSSGELKSIKCPSCGAPISPKFGEMVITCEYCGTSVSLGKDGWKNIQKHTMLPLKYADKNAALALAHDMMDKGLLRRHLQESSTLEEATLSVVPFWIIPASARTSIVATDMAAEAGSIATIAALMGVMGAAGGGFGGGGGGRGRGMGFGGGGGGLIEGALLGSMMSGMGGGVMSGGGTRKSAVMDANYNYPVVALKTLTEYQPKEYQFALDSRTLFDAKKFPQGVKVLNGDVSEDVAKYQAKTLVDQLQALKAHEKYHMIQQIDTQVDTGDGELLHVPVWFIRYAHKGNKIILILDANSGRAISSIGL